MYRKRLSLLLALVLIFTMNMNFVNAEEQTVPPQINTPAPPAFMELPEFPGEPVVTPSEPETPTDPESPIPKPAPTPVPIPTPKPSTVESEKRLDAVGTSLDELINSNDGILSEEGTQALNEMLAATSEAFKYASSEKVQEVALSTVQKTLDLMKTTDQSNVDAVRENLQAVIQSAVKAVGTLQIQTQASGSYAVDKTMMIEKALSAQKLNEELALLSSDVLDKNTDTSIRITMDADSSNSVEMELPELDEVFKIADTIEIETSMGSVAISKDMFGDGQAPTKISIREVAESELPVGFKNVKVISFKIEGGTGSINQFNKPVVVYVPYATDQTDNSELLTAFYLDENGLATPVPGFYQNGIFTFKTNHFSQYYIGTNKVDFKDVTDEWFAPYVKSLAAKGVVKGKGENLYDPEAHVTRAEFAALIARVLNYGENDVKLPYEDVSINSWYYKPVQMLFEASILESGEVFNPNEAINREEMGVILGKTLLEMGYNQVSIDVLARFSDVQDLDKETTKHIATAIQNKLLVGDAGKFTPNDKMTRAQAATVIYKLLSK